MAVAERLFEAARQNSPGPRLGHRKISGRAYEGQSMLAVGQIEGTPFDPKDSGVLGRRVAGIEKHQNLAANFRQKILEVYAPHRGALDLVRIVVGGQEPINLVGSDDPM